MSNTVPNIPELVIPDGLNSSDDPLRYALTECLLELQKNLKSDAEKGGSSFLQSVWSFRKVIDLISVFTASAAVIPLSPSDAPLPGWRRSLWRVDFSEAAGSLLSWASSYLPRRSGQSAIARGILEFLYKDYTRTSGGENRSYTALLGFGNSSDFSGIPWNIWRDKFFKSRSAEEMRRLSSGVLNYIGCLNDMLSALNVFLNDWHFEAVKNKNSYKLVMRSITVSEDIPPFMTVSKCGFCKKDLSLCVLAAPCYGKKFLYREVIGGHELSLELDPLFKRRFFTSSLGKDRNSVTSVTLDNSEADVLPLVTEGFEELRSRLLENLGEEVFKKWHVPVLAAVCESEGELPIDVLKSPNFGIRDGEFVSYRLNGLVAFGEDGRVEPRSPQVSEFCQKDFSEQCRFADMRLAMWAEAVLQQENPDFSPVQLFAVRHLVSWAKKGHNPEFTARLVAESSFMPFLQVWLKELVKSGSTENRRMALDISSEFLELLLEHADKNIGERVADLCLFRCDIYKHILDYVKAKEELDKAVSFISSGDKNRSLRANILGERARLNLELELPRLAAEDSAEACEIWNSLSELGDLNALNKLADITCLRVKANLALGQRAQAIAALQKVADKKVIARTDEEKMIWISINLHLAELIREQNTSGRQVRFRFEEVLRLARDIPDSVKLKEIKAKALCGLANDKEPEDAAEKLKKSQEYFKLLINENGRTDLASSYAEVVYRLAFLMEKSGKLDECLVYTEQAIKIYENASASSDKFNVRVSLAKLWLLRSRIEELNGRYEDAEGFIANSLSYYEGLIDDSQVRYISDLAKVMAKRGYIRVLRHDYENAKLDLELSIEKWPGAHDLKNAKAPLARVFLNLGIAYARLGNIPLALIQFEKALVIAENRGDRATCLQILSERVWILFYDGQFKRAEDDFTNIFVTNQDEQNEKNLLGRGCARIRQDKCTVALADFSQILIQYEEKSSLSAIMGAGLACLGSGDFDSAKNHFLNLLEQAKKEKSENLQSLIWLVMAHCGLGSSYKEYSRELCIEEYKQACRIWELNSKTADFINDDEALMGALSVFFLDFAVNLYNAASCLSDLGYAQESLTALKTVRNFCLHPNVYKNLPNMSFQAGWSLIKALSAVKNGKEVLQLTNELLQELKASDFKFVGYQNKDINEAWLNFNAASLVTSLAERRGLSLVMPGFCSAETVLGFAERAGNIYGSLPVSSFDINSRKDYAQCEFLLGILSLSAENKAQADKYFEKSKKIYADLRAVNGNKGFEFETCTALLNQILSDENDENSVLFLFDEMFSILSSVSELKSSEEVRKTFVSFLTDRITFAFSKFDSLRDLISDILSLSIWTSEELIVFENRIAESLREKFGRGDLAGIKGMLGSWSKIEISESGVRPGKVFLEIWQNAAMRDGAVGIGDGLYLLEELVSFGERYGQLSGWPVNFAMKAQKCLADFYASEGNSRLAVEYLDKAVSLISTSSFNDEETVIMRVNIGIKQAELLIKDNKYDKAKEVLDRTEALALDNISDPELFENIKRIRVDLFLRGGFGPASDTSKRSEKIQEPVKESSAFAEFASAPGRSISVIDSLPKAERFIKDTAADTSEEARENKSSNPPEASKDSSASENGRRRSDKVVVSVDVSDKEENGDSKRVIEMNYEAESRAASENSFSRSSAKRFIPDSIGADLDEQPKTKIEPAAPAPVSEPVEPAVPAGAEENNDKALKAPVKSIPERKRPAPLGARPRSTSLAAENAMNSFRARLSAKLNARKGENAAPAEAAPAASGGKLPASESRKISLKGAVSEEHLEKLSQKAAKAAEIEQIAASKPAPKKQISIPESLADHMLQDKMKKERQEARENAKLNKAADSAKASEQNNAAEPAAAEAPVKAPSSEEAADAEAAAAEAKDAKKAVSGTPVKVSSSAIAKLRSKLSAKQNSANGQSKVSSENLMNFASEVLGVKNEEILTPQDVDDLKKEAEAVSQTARRAIPENNDAPKEKPKVSLKTLDGNLVTLKLRARLANRGKAAVNTEAAEKDKDNTAAAGSQAEEPAKTEAVQEAPKNEAVLEDAASKETESAVPNVSEITETAAEPSAEEYKADIFEASAEEHAAVSEPEASVKAEEQAVSAAEEPALNEAEPFEEIKSESDASASAGQNFEQEVKAAEEAAAEKASEPELPVFSPVREEKAVERIEIKPVKAAAKEAKSPEEIKGIAIKGTLSVRSMLRNLGSALGFSGKESSADLKPAAEAPAPKDELEAVSEAVPAEELKPAEPNPVQSEYVPSEAPQEYEPQASAENIAYEPEYSESENINSSEQAYQEEPVYEQAEEAVYSEPAAQLPSISRQELSSSIVDAGSAFNEIDSGFAMLDNGNLDAAERSFIKVGKALSSISASSQKEFGEIIAAMLEGFLSVACGMIDCGMNKRAFDVANLASSLSRMYLSSRYDSAAWPWWGDVESKAGECCALIKRYSDSCEHYRKAIEIYLKLIDLGVGEASRADALRTLVKLGKVLLCMNDTDGAMKNYNYAVDQGQIVVEQGFPEDITMAEVHISRAELFMMNGDCASAADDFSWAIEYYTRDAGKTRKRHLMEIAAVQVRMAEALFVIGSSDEAYHYRDELDRLSNYYRKYNRIKEADIITKYVKDLDSISARYL